ncbi:hypothetical protein BDZ89DRAFT_1159839 [Hymenopellis radicata]|nr:hypothetical protein BDZ89DRAFT_1159839 [Hymenopellis radicata]
MLYEVRLHHPPRWVLGSVSYPEIMRRKFHLPTHYIPAKTKPVCFKRTLCRNVQIEFMGVWKTVSNAGVVTGKALPFTSSNNSIKTLRHALSFDEACLEDAPRPENIDVVTLYSLFMITGKTLTASGTVTLGGTLGKELKFQITVQARMDPKLTYKYSEGNVGFWGDLCSSNSTTRYSNVMV